jgi:hypothetical protein
MDTIITTNTDKQTICLQYLGISAKKLVAADGFDDAMSAMRTLKHYILLAREYGCTERQICFALGWTRDRYESLEGGI